MHVAPPLRGIKKILSNNELSDISISIGDKELLMLGDGGAARELAFLPAPLGDGEALNQRHLPVLLGSGLGHAIGALLEHLEKTRGADFRLAVVDKEEDILTASAVYEKYAAHPNILWVFADSPDEVMRALTRWQNENGGQPFLPLANPFYQRLDRAYYGVLRKLLTESSKADFWGRADYPKFKNEPRILLLTSSYFLVGDLEAACKRMGLAYELLSVPKDELAATSFVEQLLEAIIRFRPDFALTINHLGVDREGILQDLLARLRLPLASWFVDNPHLILFKYFGVVSPWTTLFTWDVDNIPSLRELGFEHVEYLPLATDHKRFRPLTPGEKNEYSGFGWQSRVSFVGNSMLHKVNDRLKAANPNPALRKAFKDIAAAFSESDERSVFTFIQKNYPDHLPNLEALGSVERQLNFEALITWEATLSYRLSCVRATLPFNPLIAGDDGWLALLPDEGKKWRWHSELSYYTELPYFYPFSEVNFNCTSKQMKGAVNQRVFDVPASGAFVITDWREQIEQLFEPGTEIICYQNPEEARDLLERYLASPADREAVTAAAMRRIMAEHLYEHRMEKIIASMRKIYA